MISIEDIPAEKRWEIAAKSASQYLRIKMRILIAPSPKNNVLDNNRCGYTTKRRT